MSALASLACAFPPAKGRDGSLTTIEDISRWGLWATNPLFVRTKADAVRLVVDANMERGTAYGHGNRAAKRQAEAEEVMLAHVLEDPAVIEARQAEEAFQDELEKDCARHRCMDDDLPPEDEEEQEAENEEAFHD